MYSKVQFSSYWIYIWRTDLYIHVALIYGVGWMENIFCLLGKWHCLVLKIVPSTEKSSFVCGMEVIRSAPTNSLKKFCFKKGNGRVVPAQRVWLWFRPFWLSWAACRLLTKEISDALAEVNWAELLKLLPMFHKSWWPFCLLNSEYK